MEKETNITPGAACLSQDAWPKDLPPDAPGVLFLSGGNMDYNSGWIKTYRKLLDWEWFKEPATAHLFQYLLLAANWDDKKWKGIEIKRGQILTGRHALIESTGLTAREIRTAIKHLKSTNVVTIKATNKFTIITICNYDNYQNSETVSDQQNVTIETNERPASDHNLRRSRIKEDIYNSDFLTFWTAYPRKTGKGAAWVSWEKLQPPIADCLRTLSWQTKSEQWTKDNGKYIPLPATYLNQRRWEDEMPQPAKLNVPFRLPSGRIPGSLPGVFLDKDPEEERMQKMYRSEKGQIDYKP